MTKIILSNSNDPFYNLAIEEWAVRNIDTATCDYLFLYVNTDCVVVGRNQNVFQEVNLKYCKEHKIQICRRVSGGGTVFHDKGNLNWTFISKFEPNKVNDYKEFSSSIISVLAKLGLDAYLNDRNAIMVDSYKLSGQAQFTNRKNILSHGTLLYNSNIEKLNSSTILKNKTVKTKATKSVRSEVKTIKDLSNTSLQYIENIIKLLINENCGDKPVFFDIKQEDIDIKIQILREVYKTQKWIYQRSSSCEITEEIEGQELTLIIEKLSIKVVKNKKGEEINQHPLLNSNYLDLFAH
jgi:lipoate-protein ligase A